MRSIVPCILSPFDYEIDMAMGGFGMTKRLLENIHPYQEANVTTRAVAGYTPPAGPSTDMVVPCEGCHNIDRCADKQLACVAYCEWMATGKWKRRSDPNRANYRAAEKDHVSIGPPPQNNERPSK